MGIVRRGNIRASLVEIMRHRLPIKIVTDQDRTEAVITGIASGVKPWSWPRESKPTCYGHQIQRQSGEVDRTSQS